MGEPESLSTQEALETHIRRHSYDRLIMVSDGIFAIAITLAALEIKLPEHEAGGIAEIAHAMTRPIVGYLLSFGIIALFWIHHRDLFARVARADSVLTGLTLLMLCLISLVPVMVPGIYTLGDDAAGFRLYVMTMVACGVVSFAMWAYACARPGVLRPEVPKGYRVARSLVALVLPVMFSIALVVPVDLLPQVMIPLGIAAGIIRRFILPRWLKSAPAG